MNISSLSQQLNMPITELRARMRDAGFRLDPRARKIPNNVAREIVRKLSKAPQVMAPAKYTGPATITVPAFITVKDFAAKLERPVTEVIKKLLLNGVMATINEEIDRETATIIAGEFGADVTDEKKEAGSESKMGLGYVYEILEKEDPAKLQPRPPIVAVMGHVDHGKTTLLDTIRKTNVVAGEAGAITQHIGAYQVTVGHPEGSAVAETEGSRGEEILRSAQNDKQIKKITFLDTPGHEAFAAMRARGANVTDIIVLVVAADDSVKPQTVEVINRAKLTKTPLIVAINKIDKPGANVEKVKGDLAALGVTVEDYGGTVPAVVLSAKTGQGLDKLLEIILLVAEVEELKANPEGQTFGTVIDSERSPGLGPVATVLIQNGVLKLGDPVTVGTAHGKVRTMQDALGRKLKLATPGAPVQVSGLSAVPEVGDILQVAASSEAARARAAQLLKQERAKRLQARKKIEADPNRKELKIILRADVQGSLEALTDQLGSLGTEEVRLTIVDAGVGEITESDIQLAASTGSVIIGFHTRGASPVLKLAAQKGVTVDQYDVIYELLEDLTEALLAMMPIQIVEERLGRARIKAVFRTEKDMQIIGGEVVEGRVVDKKKFRIWRNPPAGEAGKVQVGTGKIEELQQNRVEVNEVKTGSEFGLKVKTTAPIMIGDILEVFDENVKKKQLKAA